MSINMSIRFFRVFLLILVSLVSFTTFPSKGYSEDDWVLAVRDVKVLVYYNNTNICIDRESKQIKVWVKFIWTEKGLVEQNLKKDNISDTLCVYYINYNQRKQYLNRRINYSYSGIIIDDFSYKLNWEDILPDSIAGQVLNKILETIILKGPKWHWP